jgi:hypothetical protein
MKKILLAYGALIIVVILLAYFKFNGNFFPNLSTPKITIAKQTFNLTLAKTAQEKMKGLSNRKSLDKNGGMLFIFEKKGKYSFWMKDTFIPLDIIYIDNNKIVDILKNLSPQAGKTGLLPIYTPKTDSNYVLEINGGLSEKNKFKVGDTIKLEGIK